MLKNLNHKNGISFTKNIFTALFGDKPTIDVAIDEVVGRKKCTFKTSLKVSIKLPYFKDQESVSGKVTINLNKANSMEHLGIKIELIGEIEILGEKKSVSRFTALARDLEPPGELTQELSTYSWNFSNVEKQYETYKGKNVIVRYLIRCTLSTKLKPYLSDEEFGVKNPSVPSLEESQSERIKLEVFL